MAVVKMSKRSSACWASAMGLALAAGVQAAEPAKALVEVGKEFSSTAGMLQVPVRVVAGESAGVKVGADGRVRGKVTMVANGATNPVANHDIYLADGAKVIAAGRTDAKGAFELAAKPGTFNFYTGKFENAGVARKLNRTDAEVIQTVALEAEAPQAPAPLPAAPADKDAKEEAKNPFAGKKVVAANETVKIDGTKFAGIATQLNADGKRVPVASTGLYLLRNGAVISKTTSDADGAFTFADVAEGPVLMVASSQPLNLDAAKSADAKGMLAQNLVIAKGESLVSTTPAEFKVDGEDVLVRVQFSDCATCGGGAPVVDMAPFSGDFGTTVGATTVGAPCDSCGTVVDGGVGTSYSSGGFGGGFGGGGCVSGCGGGGGGGGFLGGRGMGLLGLAGLAAGIVALSSNNNNNGNGVGGTAATASRP